LRSWNRQVFGRNDATTRRPRQDGKKKYLEVPKFTKVFDKWTK